MSHTRVLVVEDDASILLGLRMSLEREGYEVGTATDGEQGLEQAKAGEWDLILLDIMLPRMNGYELLSVLRQRKDTTPVLLLSAKSAEFDKVMGLDLGADDFVTKPFSVAELLARVRAALRRKTGTERTVLWRFGEVSINPQTRETTRGGEPVDLTATEFKILGSLVHAAGRILSRREILDAVWGEDHHGTERTVDNFVAQLRAKLESDPTNPAHLLTVRGAGYRFVAE